MKTFETEIAVRWSDCDPNRHVRHSAYYEYGAHIRIRFFSKIGFGASKMNELNLGPILFKEECSFIRELSPEETIRINLLKGEISQDGSRWILHHEIYNLKKEKAAHITVTGAWMNLELRKLAIPPKAIAQAVHELSEGKFYVYKGSAT